MAGILKVDTLQSDSNLALKIATANVAFIDSTGLNVVGGNLTIGATQFAEGGQVQTAGIADGAVTNDKIVSVANTKLSGLIVDSQIANVNASVISSGTLGASRLPAGSVLQVVSNSSESPTSTSSTSFQASGYSVTLTPSSASNKVLIMCNSGSIDQSGTISAINIALYKNGSSLKPISLLGFDTSSSTELGVQSFVYLDSPATTSALTYELYFRSLNAGQTAYLNEGGSGTISIVAMEIAG